MTIYLRFLILCLLLWFAQVQSQNYLREPPAFFKPCPVDGSQQSECLSRLIENILKHWKNGVPGLPSAGSLDPFRVKRVRIEQHVPPNLDVQVTLRNMTTYGLSQAKILNSTTIFRRGQYSLGFHVLVPKSTIKCHYRLKGNVLLLNLNSAGNFNSELNHLEFYVVMKVTPYKMDGKTFLNATAATTKIVRVDRITVNLSNLFGGNRELERSANQLFNDNWRAIYDLLNPVLTQTFDSVLLDRFSRIFKYVPANFFFHKFDTLL